MDLEMESLSDKLKCIYDEIETELTALKEKLKIANQEDIDDLKKQRKKLKEDRHSLVSF